MRSADGPLTALARVEVAIMAFVIAFALVGVALLPLLTRPAVRTLVTALHTERDTGLSAVQTLDAAYLVLAFVTDADAPALPARVAGRDGFDAAAVAHLVDVRNVIVPARWVTLALVAVCVAWLAVRRLRPIGRQAARAALSGGGALVLGGGALVAAAGALDFDRLFAGFHGIFFDAGTWTFPYDALLIQVFPLRFWVTAGAIWAGLAIALALVALVAGRQFGYTRGR